MSEASCSVHPNLPAENSCARCDQLICGACSTIAPDGTTICPPCMARQADARFRRKLILFGGAAALVLGIVGFFVVTGLTRDEDSEPAANSALMGDFDYGDKAKVVANLFTLHEAEPCNQTIAVDLGETLNRAGDHRGALKVVDSYAGQCPPIRRLWWVELTARQRLGEWAEAAEVATRLVEAKPNDSDYWWWRGEAHAKQELTEQAAADFRQSMARRPNKFAAKWLHEIAPCDGAFALMRYVAREPRATWAEDLARETLATSDCKAKRGTGGGEIPLTDGAAKVTASLAGSEVPAELASWAPAIVIDRARAGSLGVATDGPPVLLYADGKVIEGTAATVPKVAVAGSEATDVAAIVVDAVPGDGTALIGQSFLSRFEVSKSGEAITLYELPGS